jgi:hypothetical protein
VTLPWSKFFWSDYASDPALKLCSFAAQGLWMRMLCLAAEHDPPGYVAINGRGLEPKDIARITGGSLDEVSALTSELESNGVFSRDRRGWIYSRRMKNEAKKRDIAAQNGKKGGNPSLTKQKENPASDKGEDNGSLNGQANPQKPEARSQKPEGVYSTKPSPTTSRDEPIPETNDPKLAYEYVCRAADWRAANDTQRQNGISIIAGWLALGCSWMIVEAITIARQRDPSPTRSLKRFDSTIRGMRRDQLGGELPVTTADVEALTNGVAKRLSASG